MKEKTQLTNVIEAADERIRYDSEVKNVLSNKYILAWILKWTVSEFYDASIAEIMECIEGKPEVATIPIQPGKTNKPEAIIGLPTENHVPSNFLLCKNDFCSKRHGIFWRTLRRH